MVSVRRTASMMMTAMVLAGLAACGSAEEPGVGAIYDTGPPGSEISDEVRASLGPVITVKVDITGADSVQGSTTALAQSGGRHYLKTCAEYAKGTAEKQFLTPGLLDESIGDQGLSFEVRVADYAGPGTYSKDRLVAPGMRPFIAIDESVYGKWSDNTGGEVTTDGKGGGSWTFSNLMDRREDALPSDFVSGKVSWTCKER
jgi:hypothetical protein